MPKLFISGVPGTGKTTVAGYLAQEHGYRHIDMERDDFEPRYRFSLDPAAFLAALTAPRIVVTWGFGPFADRRLVSHFIDDGFRLIWLDGDRVASFREFMRREGNDSVAEYKYYGQMQMIVATEVVRHLEPVIIRPFDENGVFRPVGKIAAEMIALR